MKKLTRLKTNLKFFLKYFFKMDGYEIIYRSEDILLKEGYSLQDILGVD